MDKLALSLYLSCFAADGATTHTAFVLFPDRVTEKFMTQKPVVNDVIITAQAAGLLWVTKDIKRSWLKWTIRGAVAGTHGAASVYNYKQIQKAK